MKIGIASWILMQNVRDYLDVPANQPLPPGDGGISVTMLCQEFLRQGHELVIFSLDPHISENMVFSGPRLKIYLLPYRLRHRARDLFRVEINTLREAMAKESVDILHAHWSYEYALAALATGTPTLVTARDAPVHIWLTSRWHPYRLVRILMAYRALRRAQHITAVSPFVQAHLRRWRFSRVPVQVVPNGVLERVFELGEAQPATPEAVRFCTTLNGWGSYRNSHVSLQAFAEVRARIPHACLLMFGDDHGPGGRAEQWARQHNLTAGVDFIGYLPSSDLLVRMAREMDVLVHPTLADAHPMIVTECMAMGKAIIGGEASGGVPWVLDYGRAGVLVNVRNPHAVAGAMLKMAQDPAYRTAMGQLARESADRRFRISNVAQAYLQIYQDILRPKSTCTV